MNIWPPFLATGIRVEAIEPDYSYVRVALTLRWYNRNYVGTHFGGSLFAMTDPFYMLMLLNRLGRDYRVWDLSASINFIKPGRGRVTAEFRVSDEQVAQAISETAGGGKFIMPYQVDIIDSDGDIVASVDKNIYIRRKRDKSES